MAVWEQQAGITRWCDFFENRNNLKSGAFAYAENQFGDNRKLTLSPFFKGLFFWSIKEFTY
jgi:hypothetical protein